jgi:hypothetical protein
MRYKLHLEKFSKILQLKELMSSLINLLKDKRIMVSYCKVLVKMNKK